MASSSSSRPLTTALGLSLAPCICSEDDIEKVLRKLIEIGIDVPPIPLPSDFLDRVLDMLVEKGYLEKIGSSRYIAKQKLFEEDARIDTIPWIERAVHVARRLGINMLRVDIPGLLWMATRIYFRSREDASRPLVTVPNRASALVTVLESLVENVSSVEPAVVSIYEPTLSDLVIGTELLYGYKKDFILEVYDYALHRLGRILKCVQLEGRLREFMLEMLAELPALDVVMTGIARFKTGISAFTDFAVSKLKENGKKIGVCIVDASIRRIEDPETLKNTILDIRSRGVDLTFIGTESYQDTCDQEFCRVIIDKLRRVRRVVDALSDEW